MTDDNKNENSRHGGIDADEGRMDNGEVGGSMGATDGKNDEVKSENADKSKEQGPGQNQGK